MQPLRQLRGPITESRESDSLLQVQHFLSVGNVFISVSYLKRHLIGHLLTKLAVVVLEEYWPFVFYGVGLAFLHLHVYWDAFGQEFFSFSLALG